MQPKTIAWSHLLLEAELSQSWLQVLVTLPKWSPAGSGQRSISYGLHAHSGEPDAHGKPRTREQQRSPDL